MKTQFDSFNKVTTEDCIDAICNKYSDNSEDSNPKNWKRDSKKGTNDDVVRLFTNKINNHRVIVKSSETKIFDIIEKNDSIIYSNDEYTNLKNKLLNPDSNDLEETIEYLNDYRANIISIDEIYPMLVNWGKNSDDDDNPWQCKISPNFDDDWDLDNPTFVDNILQLFELEAVAENFYHINNLNRFKEFKNINDKNGNELFKFVREDY